MPLGFAVGAFGTLVGAGGGFVLVPILLLIYPDEEAKTITAMSLFVVFANAVSGSLAYARQRRIDYRSGGWFALSTLPGAVAGAVVVGYIPRALFDAIFALTLTALGTFLVLRSGFQAIQPPVTGKGVIQRLVTDRYGNTFSYSLKLWKGIAFSGAIGFVSSLLGIGGGVIHVPVMTTVLHFPIHIATATSQFVLAFMAAEGTAVHLLSGTLSPDNGLGRAILLAVGAIPGAQLGAFVARRVHSRVISRALAVALVIVGLRLGLKAAGVV
ncbi:MAG: sulfite exporter TauE/SafE family protein [Dehalococcoidia bacterium]